MKIQNIERVVYSMKRVSDFKIFIFILMLVFVIPTSTLASEFTPYGAGEWDLIYDSQILVTSSGTNTSTVTSGGGDIRVCISGVEHGNLITAQFYISTGNAILPGMFVTNNSGSPSAYECLSKIDVRPYVDSTGKVKLYLKVVSKNQSSDIVRIVIED